MTLKTELRKKYSILRKALPEKRRIEAKEAIEKKILDRNRGRILSYWPIGSELDLAPLNRVLAQEGRLLLAGVFDDKIIPFEIRDPDTELKLVRMRIWEPDPSRCLPVEISQIDFVLVPALCFDRKNNRLGYGEGWYDRFLSKYPELYSIGVGYQEQLSNELIPKDIWDIPVREVILV